MSQSELVGKWKNVRDENFSDYLKAFGFGVVMRNLAERLHPDVTITVDGDTWSLRTQTGLLDQTVNFTLNEPFQTNIKGVSQGELRCVITLEDGKLLSESTPVVGEGGGETDVKATREVRQVIDGEMVHTMTCEGVTCKRYFKRLE